MDCSVVWLGCFYLLPAHAGQDLHAAGLIQIQDGRLKGGAGHNHAGLALANPGPPFVPMRPGCDCVLEVPLVHAMQPYAQRVTRGRRFLSNRGSNRTSSARALRIDSPGGHGALGITQGFHEHSRVLAAQGSDGACHEPQLPSSQPQRGKNEGVRFSFSPWLMLSARGSHGHLRRYWAGTPSLAAIWLSARVC